jgi:hypothetical protein
VTEFNAGAHVVALVTGLRAGLDVGEAVRMTDEAVRDGAASDQEVIFRLAELVGAFAVTTAFACHEWDRVDGTGAGTRYMAALGQVAAENPG